MDGENLYRFCHNLLSRFFVLSHNPTFNRSPGWDHAARVQAEQIITYISNSHFVIAKRRFVPMKQSPRDEKGIASLENARNDTILRIADLT
jgi:hypothetical protein